MKKKLLIIFIGVASLLILILTGCIMEVQVEKLVYGEGFVAQIDCFSDSSNPHRVRIQNSSGEKIKVKYSIKETNDASYDLITEPIWSTVTTNIPIENGDVSDITTDLGSLSNDYACVWMRAENSDASKYIIFSVFLSKTDKMEYDVTIKKGK